MHARSTLTLLSGCVLIGAIGTGCATEFGSPKVRATVDVTPASPAATVYAIPHDEWFMKGEEALLSQSLSGFEHDDAPFSRDLKRDRRYVFVATRINEANVSEHEWIDETVNKSNHDFTISFPD